MKDLADRALRAHFRPEQKGYVCNRVALSPRDKDGTVTIASSLGAAGIVDRIDATDDERKMSHIQTNYRSIAISLG